jgi:hypothetical protein
MRNLNRAVPEKFHEPVNGGSLASALAGPAEAAIDINLPHPLNRVVLLYMIPEYVSSILSVGAEVGRQFQVLNHSA